MAERIRYHLDEHIDPDIARALRRHGIDVTTTVEARLLSRSDLAQIAYAKESGRVIVTHDTDFLRMASEDSRPSRHRLLSPDRSFVRRDDPPADPRL